MPNYDGQVVCGSDVSLAVGQMYRWPSPDVTWGIAATLPGFALESFRSACELAWSYWSGVCGIRPRYVESGFANISIGLQTLGPGNVLADAELPVSVSMSSSLRMRIDTAEAWVVADNPPPNKIDLVRVICHELGHIGIGIGHINSGNLMAPTYSSSIRSPRPADIAEGVSRYGLPTSPPLPPPVDPPSSNYEEVYALLSKGGQLFVRAKGVVRQL